MRTLMYIGTLFCISGFGAFAAAADRAPAELPETFTPSYRNGDISVTSGTHYVWVKRIEGRDSEGNRQVLFNDLQGALLPLERLNHATQLINPLRSEVKGRYQELRIQLAEQMLTIDSRGMKHSPLPSGLKRTFTLAGELEISKSEVSTQGMKLQPASHNQLALNHR